MKLLGRWALALVLIILSGSMSNAHVVGHLPVLVAFLSIVALVWAIVGSVRAVRRARRT